MKRFAVCGLLVITVSWSTLTTALAEVLPVQQAPEGKLTYHADERGNQLPDFSNCGYAGGDRPIPDAPARVRVEPADGDDGRRIQTAIDYVSAQPLDSRGLRGAVLLAEGTYEIEGQLTIRNSGVVLRGRGALEGGTVLVATGNGRRPLIRVLGQPPNEGAPRFMVTDEYVPVGRRSFHLSAADAVQLGDSILITRPCTDAWVDALGMSKLPNRWKAGTRELIWDRTVTKVAGTEVTIDAPVTSAIDHAFGGATVQPYRWTGRVERVGIEDLRLQCSFSETNPLDEDHAWFGVTMENARDCWIRRVEFRHFAGGAVSLRETTSRITVADCIA